MNMAIERMGARKARNSFADVLGTVHYGDQVIVVERFGRPMVAVIPAEMYERLVAEREARFEVLDRMRDRAPDVAPAEVERDVAAAIAAIRARAADAESGA
jgi:prevent-host-death family protein